MKLIYLIFCAFLFAEVATCLECYTCVGPSCTGSVSSRDCGFLGQDTSCVSYEISGVPTKSCYLSSLCDSGSSIPGINNINCCTTDLCNSSVVLKANHFVFIVSVVLIITLKLYIN